MDSKEPSEWGVVTASQLAEIIKTNIDRVLVIDSRSFLEYNTCHIVHAINVCCSKLVKRRLQQDKVSVKDLLAQTCQIDTVNDQDIIVYDQCSVNTFGLSKDCFMLVLLNKLMKTFGHVYILKGGFLEFQAHHPSLCESKTTTTTSSGGYKCPPLTSMSQPCLPVSNVGPTKILPFLYLGSQQDALSADTMQQNGITYVLNVSTSCPQPPCISESHFLRVAVNDNYSDKLLPLFPEAFQFLDKVREASGCVLIHCLAGISRSATVAIAYIMYHLQMSSDEAYKYVKDKRPTISPNFNFLGQLLEYEKQLKKEKGEQENVSPPLTAPVKKHCADGAKSPVTPKSGKARFSFKPFVFKSHAHTSEAVQSPSTALSKLSFSAPSPILEDLETPKTLDLAFPQFPTTSLDRLSFTPCLASDNKEPNPARGTGGEIVKSPSAGTKRPLSSTLSLELDIKHTQESSGFSYSGGHCSPPTLDVKLRSPEMKAKRPLVRPNSIAFSSYPLFDLPSCSEVRVATSESSQAMCSVMDYTSGSNSNNNEKTVNTSTATTCSNNNTTSHSTKTISNTQTCPANLYDYQEQQQDTAQGNCMVTSASSYVVEMRTKECGQQQQQQQQQQQARKSRSLEDILNMDGEEQIAVGGCPSHVRSRRQKKLLNAAELLSQASGMDAVHRCRGPGESHHHHQSNSSISSSGSHSSLHGSLEIIQVS